MAIITPDTAAAIATRIQRWARAAGNEPIAAWARAIVNAAIDATGVP
jgi:hypothetical protein